ncbi:MAG: hypothetical protein R3Y11_04930 [Pseudomonadota bacterium]
MSSGKNVTPQITTDLRSRDYKSLLESYEKRVGTAIGGSAENELLRDKVNDRRVRNLVLYCAIILVFLFFGIFVFILMLHFEELILGLHKSQFIVIPISMLAILPVVLMIAVVNKVFASPKKDVQKHDSEQSDVDMKSYFDLLKEMTMTLKELVASLKGG